MLFTSPGFQWGSRTYGATIVSASVSVREEDLPTDALRREFGLPADSPAVIFTSRQPKTDAFRRIKAQLSYGDSDGDIRDSIQAGARPVRVLRSPGSVNHEPAHNGAFGEDVLEHSEND